MDKTYRFLYEQAYKHLYRYCVTGKRLPQDTKDDLNYRIKNTKDDDLIRIYELIQSIDPLEPSHFYSRKEKLEKAISPDSYEYIWYLNSILLLVYQYIYPDRKLFEKSKTAIDNAEKELKKQGVTLDSIIYDSTDYTIQMHVDKNSIINDAYEQQALKRDFRLSKRSFMTILKGFSSSTPFFYSALKERFHNIPIKGGGYFLKWKNYGIVVDPGISFMENMHCVGLNVNDINAVFVTHNHIDHNGDLLTIDDLASQCNKNDIILFSDKQTEEEYRNRLKKITKINRINPILDKDFNIGYLDEINVKITPTEHIYENNILLKNVSFAIKFSFKEDGIAQAVVGFTSDTVYLNEFEDFFHGCNYIIANISETNRDDYIGKKKKKNHLGYQGCVKIVNSCCNKASDLELAWEKTRLIVSEFWAGKGDVRMELARALRKSTGYKYIYPGDIGMTFFLDQPTFLCGHCEKEEKLENLNIIRSGIEYSGILTFCNECILS